MEKKQCSFVTIQINTALKQDGHIERIIMGFVTIQINTALKLLGMDVASEKVL